MFSFKTISLKAGMFRYNVAPTPTTGASVTHMKYNFLIMDIYGLKQEINFGLLLCCNIRDVITG